MSKLRYERIQSLPESGIDLLENTVYGTKGVRIRHLDASKKALELIDSDYHVFFDGENVVAVIVFCKRKNPYQEVKEAYYIRYFSVHADYQQFGLGKLLVSKAVEYYEHTLSDPTLVYAYIEGKNLRSLSVSKHFAPELHSSFRVTFFNRFFPKKKAECERVANSEDMEYVKRKLREAYSNTIAYNENRIGYENNYFVIKRGGEIKAGLQAIPTNWEVVDNPGFAGFLIQNVFSKLPVINRLAQGKDMKFVGVEGVFYSSVSDLELLLEHVLADLNRYVAFLYFDEKDPRQKQVVNGMRLGLMSKIQPSPKVNVLHFKWKISNETAKQLERSDNYISAYDVT